MGVNFREFRESVPELEILFANTVAPISCG